MSARRTERQKAGTTPKRPRRYRSVSHHDLAGYAAGFQAKPFRRCLSAAALWEALNRLASDAVTDDDANDSLRAMAGESDEESLKAWCDWLADRNPDDPRWDAWRTYRRFEAS